ncbi:hypothetical protein D4764_15G0009150 [Takifugu flavidus]|uniref:Uncharacterized protein n=1 Tax=Takifugu flavidus TaxID=433684 RepID=A0A5C6P425_9TELE|nr:hypothetical protein D4764_15G0009150 [Takifugu flavidus]
MDSCAAFQSKLTNIMEMLAKAAVLEISKLWEDGFSLVQVELRRKENEIEALNRKLVLIENERLYILSKKQSSCLSTSSFSNKEQQNSSDGPEFDSAQTSFCDPSFKDKTDPLATQRTQRTPPSPTDEQLESDCSESDGRKHDGKDFIIKSEEQGDVVIMEKEGDTKKTANEEAVHNEMELNQQPFEVDEGKKTGSIEQIKGFCNF